MPPYFQPSDGRSIVRIRNGFLFPTISELHALDGTKVADGGTLKFKKAKGSLHFSGHYDRKAGSFNVTLTGSLTY